MSPCLYVLDTGFESASKVAMNGGGGGYGYSGAEALIKRCRVAVMSARAEWCMESFVWLAMSVCLVS